MISFVIATYQRPAFLGVLLHSLLAQTDPMWEALVMDEGDNRDVVERIGDHRISHHPVERREFDHPNILPGYGSYGIWPKHDGAALAGGDFLCFPSEDIYFFPTYVAEMSGHAEDIVGCSMLVMGNDFVNGFKFFPNVGMVDYANYVIRPEWYRRHPFIEFFPDRAGTADGLCAEACVQDGATWRRIPKFLTLHADVRPDPKSFYA